MWEKEENQNSKSNNVFLSSNQTRTLILLYGFQMNQRRKTDDIRRDKISVSLFNGPVKSVFIHYFKAF